MIWTDPERTIGYCLCRSTACTSASCCFSKKERMAPIVTVIIQYQRRSERRRRGEQLGAVAASHGCNGRRLSPNARRHQPLSPLRVVFRVDVVVPELKAVEQLLSGR